MQHSSRVRRKWLPETESDAEKVRETLDVILRTPRFVGSRRYPALLRYVVEKTLRGEAEGLKERTIGIEVFSRPANYDTGSDTVVRYTAGEVRKRLSLYYHEDGAGSSIQIDLPLGSYVPDFYLGEEDTLPKVLHLDPAFAEEPRPESPAGVEPQRRVNALSDWRVRATAVLAIALSLALAVGLWVRVARTRNAVFNTFWAPLTTSGRGSLVIVCPAAIVFSPTEQTGVDPAQSPNQDALMSSETARSMSRISDLLGERHVPFMVRLPAVVSDDDLRRHPAVLIGAYNNVHALAAANQLRYRFSARSTQSIYDATQPSIFWARPRSWQTEPGNDYALFARFLNPQTRQWTYVIAGLGRAGTEAATGLVTSPAQMASLASQLPGEWSTENLEVVLRVEIRTTRAAVEPTIEAVWVWK